MSLSRDEQAKFAKIIKPLAEQASDPATLAHLHDLAVLVLELSGFEDNGIAFDTNEYIFELKEAAEGKKPTGWGSYAKESLEKQLNDH